MGTDCLIVLLCLRLFDKARGIIAKNQFHNKKVKKIVCVVITLIVIRIVPIMVRYHKNR